MPLRSITDAIGAAIKWNASMQTASVMLKNSTVDITAGAASISIKGVSKRLDARLPSFIRAAKQARCTSR
ncbi:stalk domain-containing protein [Paenibacillus sp. Soil522]|uniref:stalk domain-containing protein n=1 Tax=Paenibacillus sp. Soil522 TaxID=1736388 RepID=UPI0007011EBA|nr:hypothetical protein ASG81_26295 [Paenibacillus sp. Soil522]